MQNSLNEIHVNRIAVSSRATPAQKISLYLNCAEPGRGTDQGAARAEAAGPLPAERELVKAGRRANPGWDLQERGSFGSQLSS
jgi:hypothetical protein